MSRHRLSLKERAEKLYRGKPFKRYDPETGERVEQDGSPVATMAEPYAEGPHATGTSELPVD